MSAPPARAEPGAWGPVIRGGQRWPRLRRFAAAVGVVLLTLTVAAATTGVLLYRTAESNLTRVPIGQLDEPTDPDEPLNILVVGSDSRQGLSAERRRELDLGSSDAFAGQRSDTIILVSVTPDRERATVISFPRDLRVLDDGVPRKIAETFADGADNVVEVVRDSFDIPIHHYVQVSVPGFLEVVETVGSVGLCLDEPLRDPKAGADLSAGCQRLSPEQALAFVRSRQGARGDFERIERQQQFLRAMLDEITRARTLVDLPKLFALVEEVAGHVTTDEDLGIGQMRNLAQELRSLASGRIPMTFVPGYTRTIDGASYILRYVPGAEALFSAVRRGEPVEPRGDPQQRAEVGTVLWATGGAAAEIVASTLHWSGFDLVNTVGAPTSVSPPRTVVYAAPGSRTEAGWVAATLGTTVRSWPSGVDVPPDASVAVAVGEDADPAPEPTP